MKPNNEDRPYEVLVVDDSALVGESLRLLLASQGFVVKKVTSTEEAQRVLADEPFDLVIIDPVLKPSSSGKAQLAAALPCEAVFVE